MCLLFRGSTVDPFSTAESDVVREAIFSVLVCDIIATNSSYVLKTSSHKEFR